MKYRVLAHSKETGQKITLEFEAQSKADAERKAKPHNINIIRIEPAEADSTEEEKEWKTIQPRRSFKLPWGLIFLVVAAGAIYCFWPTIHAMISSVHAPAISRPAGPSGE